MGKSKKRSGVIPKHGKKHPFQDEKISRKSLMGGVDIDFTDEKKSIVPKHSKKRLF